MFSLKIDDAAIQQILIDPVIAAIPSVIDELKRTLRATGQQQDLQSDIDRVFKDLIEACKRTTTAADLHYAIVRAADSFCLVREKWCRSQLVAAA